MSRYRLEPSRAQEAILLRLCSDARYVWNLCVEQETWWRRDRSPMPSFAKRCRQLTEARADNSWLAEGSVIVQQQAIRDHGQAMARFFAGIARRPRWRKKGEDEGFRIIAVKPSQVRRLNRNHGEVLIPRVGWVRFRWSRAVPAGAKSFRVTCDRAGRWHVAFAVIPEPIPAPGNGLTVGIDRGIAVSAALSTGEMLKVPGLTTREVIRLRRLERRLAKAERGSGRRSRAKGKVAQLRARDTVRRLEQKAPGRVDKVPSAYTSQRCSVCGHVDQKSRESQAVFWCTACAFCCNADVNAARNIAAGHAVSARGGDRVTAGPLNREPQLALLAS